MENKEVKKSLSDAERLELATKLDKELDEFINNLPKRKYEDGRPEDNWQEEIEKHPFFMKKPPQPGDEVHPLYEGLQKLKYDPEENEPHELALAYKDDGNFNFKHKNYRLAVIAYTEGIKIKCDDVDLQTNLYNNRAAAHYFLKNYRSCINDCLLALKLKPIYDKVLHRLCQCYYELKQYDKCIEYCDKILEQEKGNKDITQLRTKSVNGSKIKERDERKNKNLSQKKTVKEKVLLEAIKERGVTVEGAEECLSLNKLEPCFPQLVYNQVYLDDSGNLVWPVVFLYPEYKIMDYIQEFNENHSFYEQISHVLQEFPEWDEEHKYVSSNMNVYFETKRKKIVTVDHSKTLGEILKIKEYVVQAGTPSFLLLVRNSKAEERFLEEY